MVRRKTARAIRKTHRYLGIFLGIQFLMWTISGIYFSWTDLDEIHGDHFRSEDVPENAFTGLSAPVGEVKSLEFQELAGEPYYYVNESYLLHAQNGKVIEKITPNQAISIARRHMDNRLKISGWKEIESTGNHHEYRGGPLPAYVISFEDPEDLRAYISAKDGSFRMIRHRDWRWFDFLWMTHTMDYETRDDINNTLLRIFSLLGLITVISGFVLWYISSGWVRSVKKWFR